MLLIRLSKSCLAFIVSYGYPQILKKLAPPLG